MRERIRDYLEAAGVLLLLGGLLAWPEELTAAAKAGGEVALGVMLPALFPFFVVSELTIRLGLAEGLGRVCAPVMRRLFRVSGEGAAAVLLGFVGGYPVGARTVIGLYRAGRLTKGEAERLLSFANNSGPAFILGVVGPCVFSARRTGLILYAAHALASLTVGLLFRFWGGAAGEGAARRGTKPGFAAALTGAIREGFAGAVSLCGFLLFFTVLTKLLYCSGFTALVARLCAPLGLPGEELLAGVLELTGGVWSLRAAGGSFTARVALTAFLLGWAGLSVHAQVLSFLEGTELSPAPYFLGKLLHGLLSAGIVILLGRVTDLGGAAPALLVEELAGLGCAEVLAVSLPAAAFCMVLLLLL
ncbi:MAG: nucleoside recognition domain-containing protein [bacterium]